MKRVLIVLAVWALVSIRPAPAAETSPPWQQVLVLHPARSQGPSIPFDYNFRNALPPFEKEPALAGKEVARGLIPTVPPTPLLRNVTDGELYLNVDHGRDFLTGSSVTYTSQCPDGVHVIFSGVHVITQQEALAIPYTVAVHTYRTGYAGWLWVQSGWSGTLARDGQSWNLTVIDNLDGRIDGQDRLHVLDLDRSPKATYHDVPVPGLLSLAGHTYRLDFTFKPAEPNIVLETLVTEVQLPRGELEIEAEGCRSLDLQDDRHLLLLANPQGRMSVPAGNYRVSNCSLRSQGQPLQFVGCERTVSVPAGQTANFRIGLPLSNTIAATRDRNLLHLTYQLVGAGGETYRLGGLKGLPSFRIYQGPFRLAGGAFGHG
ncbi:MAG: hypothetical protein MUC88_07400 [Planctomycetes bacterium]|nr:hypothetical protein [Planctomycetota bacterium]